MTGEEHAARLRPFLTERFEDLSLGSKNRTRLLNRLCHRYEDVLNWKLARPNPDHTPEAIGKRLAALGATSTCYVLCMPDEWDGREVPLTDALTALVGNGLPALLVCGSVAYFEPEYESGPAKRFLLTA
jgi:hypothetical protein